MIEEEILDRPMPVYRKLNIRLFLAQWAVLGLVMPFCLSFVYDPVLGAVLVLALFGLLEFFLTEKMLSKNKNFVFHLIADVIILVGFVRKLFFAKLSITVLAIGLIILATYYACMGFFVKAENTKWRIFRATYGLGISFCCLELLYKNYHYYGHSLLIILGSVFMLLISLILMFSLYGENQGRNKDLLLLLPHFALAFLVFCWELSYYI